VQRERGIKLDIKGAPAIAFVDGKMIRVSRAPVCGAARYRLRQQ
jgi:hypothetical protein